MRARDMQRKEEEGERERCKWVMSRIKKERRNSMKKETCRGNKVIIGGEKSRLCFLTSELFSYSPPCLLSFICKKREIGGSNEREREKLK